MIDKGTLDEIGRLSNIYEMNWGVPLNITTLPSGLTQEKLVVILKRIVETGESILVGYEKIFLE